MIMPWVYVDGSTQQILTADVPCIKYVDAAQSHRCYCKGAFSLLHIYYCLQIVFYYCLQIVFYYCLQIVFVAILHNKCWSTEMNQHGHTSCALCDKWHSIFITCCLQHLSLIVLHLLEICNCACIWLFVFISLRYAGWMHRSSLWH